MPAPATRQSNLFRSISLVLGVMLAAYATMGVIAQWSRPAFRTMALFGGLPQPPVADDKSGALAAAITIDGDVLSDYATQKARRALDANPPDAAANAEAQGAALSALAFSPVNSTGWLVLALLRAQINGPTAGALKMSYFTGPVPPDALAARIKVLATTAAATDEDLRVFAQSDVRTILTRHGRLQAALAATYRQANADGKKFLTGATQAVDPKFSATLKP